MKGKIIKSIMTVLFVCCISVPMSGCAFVNPDVRDNFEGWFEDFLGGVFGDADDNDEDNENEGNQNGNGNGENGNVNEENGNVNEEKPATPPPADTIEVSGEMINDMVNKIVIRPSKTMVGVGETFTVEVEPLEGTLSDTPVFSITEEYAEFAQVDENGNVTALKVGEAIVSVAVGENKYNVETTIVAEPQDSDTYALNCVYIYEDFTVVVIPHEVKMHIGDVFTVTADDTTMENVTLTAEEIAARGYVSITGTTITAVKKGYTEVLVRWGGIYPYIVKITIIE